MKLPVFLSLILVPFAQAATRLIDLGGPATGYLALANFKNSLDQPGIMGSNGLPDYPHYQIPVGQTNAGRWTAIVASPQFAGADYSALYGNAAGVTVGNLTVTDSNYSTMSSGVIGFDDSLITGVGTETVPVSALTFNFDTYNWNGVTGNGWDTNSFGSWRSEANGWNMQTNTIAISPFSPVYTTYNDGGGAGNAAAFYNLSLTGATGNGLTFVDGQLTNMDINAGLAVYMRIGNFPAAGGATFTGTFSASGLNYSFNVDDTKSVAVFTGIHMVMNRAGTASVIPEPASMTIAALGLLAAFRRRRAR